MPLDENIVSWNVTNWITVVLMVAIGFTVVGFAQRWWAAKQAA
jgi:hypothetical protein